MDCLWVREHLTESALSTLAPEGQTVVEQHLEWCAGCRKEMAELRGAAAQIGLALPQVDPPADLEERLVQRFRQASARRSPWRRRFRVLTAATIAAAVLAVLGIGWGAAMFAKVQSTDSKLAASQDQARLYVVRIHDLLDKLANLTGQRTQVLRQAQLIPPASDRGGGAALLSLSKHREDWALVIVGGLSGKALPYTVFLVDEAGNQIPVKRIQKLDAGGGAQVWREYGIDLSHITKVIVRDAHSRVILIGQVASKPGAVASP